MYINKTINKYIYIYKLYLPYLDPIQYFPCIKDAHLGTIFAPLWAALAAF